MSNEIEYSNEVKWLDTAKIKPNNYNPNYMPPLLFSSLTDGIKNNKFFGTIIVNKNGIIIDGEHRYLALKKLGAKKIPCIIEDVDDDQAKILTIRINRERGFLTPTETGNVLKKLQKTIPIDVLAKKIDIPEKEITLLTALKYDPLLDGENAQQPVFSWAEIEHLITRISNELRGTKVKSISTVSRGGLIPARLVADSRGIKQIYVDETEIKGDIFIDDIYDTGQTYTKIKRKAKNKDIPCYFLLVRKGKELPKNAFAAEITTDQSYVVFPWDKIEAKKLS